MRMTTKRIRTGGAFFDLGRFVSSNHRETEQENEPPGLHRMRATGRCGSGGGLQREVLKQAPAGETSSDRLLSEDGPKAVEAARQAGASGVIALLDRRHGQSLT